MSESNDFKCDYCNKAFSSVFLLKEHISYGHKFLKDFENSNIKSNILKRIKKLEDTISVMSSQIYNQDIQIKELLLNLKNHT